MRAGTRGRATARGRAATDQERDCARIYDTALSARLRHLVKFVKFVRRRGVRAGRTIH